jgi:flagellar basal-body rod protein FlgC
MKLFSSMHISASALTAERLRMNVISNNIANAHSTRTASGKAYQRERVVFSPIPPTASGAAGGGVKVVAIVADPRPGSVVHDPSHPDADEQGNVTYPNVDIATEMVDMISAARAYEANAVALQTAKMMVSKALEITQG